MLEQWQLPASGFQLLAPDRSKGPDVAGAFRRQQLRENAEAFLREVLRLRPSSAKGTYVRSVTLSTTMGPAVPVDRNAAVGNVR